MLTIWPRLEPSSELSPVGLVQRSQTRQYLLAGCILRLSEVIKGGQCQGQALIVWPWQEARWCGMGHHLPGERSAVILLSPILCSFISLHLLPRPSTRKLRSTLSMGAAKSPGPNARLIFQAAIHLTSKCNNIPFAIIARIGIGPARFP